MRIIRRNDGVRGARDGFGIFFELREVAINQAEQAEVHEQRLHRRVADAFTER